MGWYLSERQVLTFLFLATLTEIYPCRECQTCIQN